MQHAPTAESHDLHFDVTCALDEAFDIKCAVAERFLGLSRGPLKPFLQGLDIASDNHSTSSAACRCLRDDGKSNLLRIGYRFAGAGDLVTPGGHCDAGGLGKAPCREFIADCLDGFGRWPYKHDPVFFAKSSKRSALRQEAVPRMQCVATRAHRRVYDEPGIEIGRPGSRRTQHHDPVRLACRKAFPIDRRRAQNRFQAELPSRPNDTKSDLPAVGYEDPAQLHDLSTSTRNRTWSNSTSSESSTNTCRTTPE